VIISFCAEDRAMLRGAKPILPERDRERRWEAVRRALARRGWRSLNQASRAVDFDYTTLVNAINYGLAKNPRLRTVDALDRLGIYEILREA
jgi:hypothetical protein